jgi:hypothetical protein
LSTAISHSLLYHASKTESDLAMQALAQFHAEMTKTSHHPANERSSY